MVWPQVERAVVQVVALARADLLAAHAASLSVQRHVSMWSSVEFLEIGKALGEDDRELKRARVAVRGFPEHSRSLPNRMLETTEI